MTKQLTANNGFSVNVIADSLYGAHRLFTAVVCFPRCILAEFNTHRMLSRNSASSRAIPVKKMLKLVREAPFIPIAFQKDHSGMQGSEYFEGTEKQVCESMWLTARDKAVRAAVAMHEQGVTKQLVNRLLEPFLWHTVLVSATEWENFFALRVHEAAEIHMQRAAGLLLHAYNNHQPTVKQASEWHVPFADNVDMPRLVSAIYQQMGANQETAPISAETKQQYLLKVAVARCARVSYLNFDGSDDYLKDFALHDTMAESGHWSPFEHVAMSLPDPYRDTGNFKGWVPYRKFFQNENRRDDRVVKFS